jgi:hypothetical protein
MKNWDQSDYMAGVALLFALVSLGVSGASCVTDRQSLAQTKEVDHKSRAQLCHEAIVLLQSTIEPSDVAPGRPWTDSAFSENYGFDQLNAPTVRLRYATAKQLASDVPDGLTFADYLVLAQANRRDDSG